MIMLCLIRHLFLFFNPHNPVFTKIDKLHTLHVVIIWLTPNEGV